MDRRTPLTTDYVERTSVNLGRDDTREIENNTTPPLTQEVSSNELNGTEQECIVVRALVSSIIIFLNEEKFIQEAIESVIDQTYSHWEILLVDDGSTDASTEIAEHYVERFPEKIRYFEHPGHENRGMSASRNLGVCHAKGEYIAFLDADDVWLPHKLESQVKILEKYPEAALVFGPWQSWYSWRDDGEHTDWIQNLHVASNRLVHPPGLIPIWIENEEAIPGHCATLLRHSVFQKVGNFEEDFRDMYEDAVWLSKVCLETPVFVETEWRSRYRQHSERSCEKVLRLGQMGEARLIFLKWLAAYVTRRQKDNEKEKEVGKILQQVLWPHAHPILNFGLRFTRQPTKEVQRLIKRSVQAVLSVEARRWFRTQLNRYKCWQLVGKGRLGGLVPIRRNFGLGQGQCIDRYYIELFLTRHAMDIHGHVLEIQENTYTHQFGGDRVTQSDVLHVTKDNPQSTIISDLARADHIPSETFDCVILTQTLQFIYDIVAAIRTCYRVLKPGGVLLATLPGIQQIDHSGKNSYDEFWRFTTRAAQQLFNEVFPEHGITVQAYGNVLATTAFLHGLVREELSQEQLDYRDKDYEMTVTVRARKPQESPA